MLAVNFDKELGVVDRLRNQLHGTVRVLWGLRHDMVIRVEFDLASLFRQERESML